MITNMGDNMRGTRLFGRALSVLLAAVLLCVTLLAGEAQAAGSQMIVVNKKTNKLAFFEDGRLVRVFPVATGKEKSLTPEGSFKLVSKIKDRPYYKEHIAGGDPANPLGDRWLGLDVNGTRGTTYAIHGNNNENSIGKYVSAGCIRMHNDDIHWLFPRVQRNITVVITSTTLDMEGIAQKYGYGLDQKIFAGSIVADGKKVILSRPFLMKDSRVYVPLRETTALLGSKLGSTADGALTVTTGTRVATFKPLAGTGTVNGQTVSILPSKNLDGTLMIPLSAVPQLFGMQVKWDGASGTATIQ
ncbi:MULTISPECIES: L,D-transpeptidase family protein [Paenibacillus]|uniref:L,D-transpeptidase family protein n=1 Tax=Paenibacillus TaxID=44249 RepID=UPI001F008EFC|nr:MULTISPECIES: L,D-transpeptidase family protein [Paenibacillus]